MDAHVQMADPVDAASAAMALIEARQTILPKRLHAPGPDDAQLQQILLAASHAPDHDRKLPWRFVIIPEAVRPALGDVFAKALLARDAAAAPEQLAQAREKALRAPLLLLAIARLRSNGLEDDVPETERLVSAGCAIQNMLLVATAQGFGSALTSGKAMGSTALRQFFELEPGEEPLCFISIGTPGTRKPARARPQPRDYVSILHKAA